MPVPLVMTDASRVTRMVNRDMQRLAEDISKKRTMRELLLEIAYDVLSPSIAQNFQVGGRPDSWQPSKPDSQYRKSHGGGAGPLVVTRRLSDSAKAKARWKVNANVLTYGYFPARSWYALVHDQGSETANIPQRPFALIQESDANEIQERTGIWIEKKVNEHIRLRYA